MSRDLKEVRNKLVESEVTLIQADCKCKGPEVGAGLSQKWLGDQCSYSSERGGDREKLRPERPAHVPLGDVVKTLNSWVARALPRSMKM